MRNKLRELETDALVYRQVFATAPPTGEYSVTAKGETIKQMRTLSSIPYMDIEQGEGTK